jgi:DNA-binding HxlR family transcriptional regulator
MTNANPNRTTNTDTNTNPNTTTAASQASPEEILRALADPERLALAGILAQGPRTVSDLAAALRVTPRRLGRQLNRLTAVGIIRAEPDRRTYSLVPETLRAAAREVGPSREPGMALGAVFEQDESVLRQYFRAGRLQEIPAKRSKRLVVLDRLSLEFEPGVRYSERDVSTTLARFHDDYAALRRYLVDEGFLSRERGVYWRSGGRVDLDRDDAAD